MNTLSQQLRLFDVEETLDIQEWGTFKDSLRAPIHNWFTYPAGFSYKAVEASLRSNHISEGMVVYDPFMGSGTTNITSKKHAINSYGVEAHPFVYRIAQAKLNWDIDRQQIKDVLAKLEVTVKKGREQYSGAEITKKLELEFPELVLKCFEEKTLLDLMLLRDSIADGNHATALADFLFVALTSILRQVSIAETGWPYIAPKKQKTSSLNKNALAEFSNQVLKMANDLEVTRLEANPNYQNTFHKIFNGDSRNTVGLIPDSCVDHVFTSPPYLNNFDYADRTRLELYFFGEAKTWGDITQRIRTKLITSATTQINRDDPKYELSGELRKSCPEVYGFLAESVEELSKRRKKKGGKKSYDHLVSGYFNDIYKIVADVFRVLKPNTKAIFVLGDSAPYGVHIPTDELIGKIGLGIGYSGYHVSVLRTRGGKWRHNPQRHNVELQESIVTLAKG